MALGLYLHVHVKLSGGWMVFHWVFCHMGILLQILTDNGTQFVGSLLKSWIYKNKLFKPLTVSEKVMVRIPGLHSALEPGSICCE